MIKKLREEKGLTQLQLARKIHLSKSHVSRMENTNKRKTKGYRASYTTIKLLAKHLTECPLKIFSFFADIDCKYIITTELNKHEKCEFKNCITDDLINILESNITKELRRLRLENARIKKQLKLQRRLKRNISSAYRNRNARN